MRFSTTAIMLASMTSLGFADAGAVVDPPDGLDECAIVWCMDDNPCTVDSCVMVDGQSKCHHEPTKEPSGCFADRCSGSQFHTLFQSNDGARLVQCDAAEVFWLDNSGSIRDERGYVVERNMTPGALVFRFGRVAFYAGTGGPNGAIWQRPRLFGGAPGLIVAQVPYLRDMTLDQYGDPVYASGSTIESFSNLYIPEIDPTGVTTIGDDVYWTDNGSDSLWRLTQDGFSVPEHLLSASSFVGRTLSTDGITLFAGANFTGSENMFWMSTTGNQHGLVYPSRPLMTAASEGSVAWTDGYRVYASDGTEVVTIDHTDGVTGVAFCDSRVFWTDITGALRCSTPSFK